MASEDFFVTEFGWDEDWASDHSAVIPVRECVYLFCLPFLFTFFVYIICLNYLKVLDGIKVVRQAYHGNVFVGNHCKIILRNFVMLGDVISRKAPKVCKDFKKEFGIFSDIESLCYFCEEFGHVCPMGFP